MELHPFAVAAGARLASLDRVGSTNAEAMERARAGECGPLWITAREQTSGSGRRGRTWYSPPGNLYASFLVTDPCAVDRSPDLSFVAAVAVHDAIARVAPHAAPHLQLKWPNDILLENAKLGGILSACERLCGGRLACVIGIGVNCTSHPADTAYAAISLRAAGHVVTPEALFRELSATLLENLEQWDRGNNFAATRLQWLSRATRIGDRVLVRTPREIEGIFDGVDDRGRLLLRDASGALRRLAAAEVVASSGAAENGRAE